MGVCAVLEPNDPRPDSASQCRHAPEHCHPAASKRLARFGSPEGFRDPQRHARRACAWGLGGGLRGGEVLAPSTPGLSRPGCARRAGPPPILFAAQGHAAWRCLAFGPAAARPPRPSGLASLSVPSLLPSRLCCIFFVLFCNSLSLWVPHLFGQPAPIISASQSCESGTFLPFFPPRLLIWFSIR